MPTDLDFDQIREELEKLFGTRISSRDPMMMDLAAKRIELNIHLNKVEEMLKAQQTEVSTGTLQLLEEFRRHFDGWINEGGNYLENRIEQAGNSLETRLSQLLTENQAVSKPRTSIFSQSTLIIAGGIALFLLGLVIGHLI